MQVRVTGLFCYPIKGCGGVSLEEAEVGPQGIRFDRQFMVVDEAGMFVAQRSGGGMGVEVKSMCLIKTRIQEGHIFCTAPGMSELHIYAWGPTRDELVDVQVWRTHCKAIHEGSRSAEWFTDFLSKERPGSYRLVRMPDNGERRSKDGVARVGFADGSALLVISQASLDHLNRRFETPLPMNRFRPNLVIDGCGAHDEDTFTELRIGTVMLKGADKCERCVVTTTDQDTGVRSDAQEPLRTLATYRKEQVVGSDGVVRNGVMFGRNFNHTSCGSIQVGDTGEVRTVPIP